MCLYYLNATANIKAFPIISKRLQTHFTIFSLIDYQESPKFSKLELWTTTIRPNYKHPFENSTWNRNERNWKFEAQMHLNNEKKNDEEKTGKSGLEDITCNTGAIHLWIKKLQYKELFKRYYKNMRIIVKIKIMLIAEFEGLLNPLKSSLNLL